MTGHDLIVGRIDAALSAYENTVGDIHPEDAFEILALYAHSHRFFTGEDKSVKRLKYAVESNGQRLSDAAFEEVWTIRSWDESFGTYRERYDRMNDLERESCALQLWQDLDDSSLVAEAIGHLLDYGDLPDDFGELYAEIEDSASQILDPAYRGFFEPVMTFITRLKKSYRALNRMPRWVKPSTLSYYSGAGRLEMAGLPSSLDGVDEAGAEPVKFYLSVGPLGEGTAGYRWSEGSTSGLYEREKRVLTVPVEGWDIEGALQRLKKALDESDFSG